MISRKFNGFTLKQFIVLLVVLYVGLCVFNYTNAQKGGETSNTSDSLEENLDLFDIDSTPRNYLKNGDFYSQEKPRRLVIDTSFIEKVDTALWWYNKVINEYPGTQEANEALRAKIRTIIGWTEGYGKDKKSFGLHDRGLGSKYFPIIESTFNKLEAGYPDDEYLEAFAFQIAQRYFIYVLGYRQYKYKENCLHWFEKTIELAKGKDTFYSHLARKRIKSVEGIKN